MIFIIDLKSHEKQIIKETKYDVIFPEKDTRYIILQLLVICTIRGILCRAIIVAHVSMAFYGERL